MDMAFWVFLGSFLAVVLVIAGGAVYIRKRFRSFSRRIFGRTDILNALKEIDTSHLDTPRSLNGCDSLLLPQILKDFPDFDVTLTKTYARDELRKRFNQKPDFKIHNVVISRYLRSEAQRTIIFQAAVCFRVDGEMSQKRYDLHYTHLLSAVSDSVAANCPNCGGALGYGVINCPFCGSRVANVLGNTWKFTEVRET